MINTILKMTSICATTLLVLGAQSAVFAETLTLNVKTKSPAGTVRAAVFDSQKAFDADKMTATSVANAKAGTSKLTIKNLKPGTYGIALFQDVNGNEKLDTNLLGVPSEPFGFSNNPKIGFSAPKFAAFQFKFDGTPQNLNITLNGG